MIKKIGKTTYKVHVHLSNTSTETMNDKIKRVFKMKFIRYCSRIPVSILPESWFLKAGIFNRGQGIVFFSTQMNCRRKWLRQLRETRREYG